MSYKCKILLDSISETGKRLTTFEVAFPNLNSLDMLTLANLYSNRLLSIERKINDYVKVIISGTEFDNFFKNWCISDEYEHIGIRRIADLMYEAYHAYDNLDGIPSTDTICKERLIGDWRAVQPQKLKIGEWHCPLVYEEDDEQINTYIRNEIAEFSSSQNFAGDLLEIKKRISVARCARVSYSTYDGKKDIEKDLELFERLRTSGYWSPFEHVATPYFHDRDVALLVESSSKVRENIRSGNFIGWKQWRSEFPDNNCIYFRK